MNMRRWRVTVDGTTTEPLNEDQREQLICAFDGYPHIADIVSTRQITVEVDVRGTDALDAILNGVGKVMTAARDIIGTIEVTGISALVSES